VNSEFSFIVSQQYFLFSIFCWDVFVLCLTFGGMWRWRRVAVARVFALVVRCWVMRLLLYCRVGKNRDTRRESPAGAGAACAASHRTVLFSQKILAAQKPMPYTDLLCAALIMYYQICGVKKSPSIIRSFTPSLVFER